MKLVEIQRKIAEKVELKDDFKEIRTIGGVDIAYQFDEAVTAIVVFDFETLEKLEQRILKGKVKFPYIPGFLAFREGPLIIEAYKKLKKKPDVLLINGHGVAHPRRCGLASFVGVKIKKPTIGVAKKLLKGTPKGTYSISKGYYISPGNKISKRTALKVVKKCQIFKMPEPLREAHLLANENLTSFAGIDLAAKEENKTGICILKGRKVICRNVRSDREILEMIEKYNPKVIAVDAPLTFSKKPYRKSDLALVKMGYKLLPLNTPGMRELSRRAMKLKRKIKELKKKIKVIECHASSSLKALGVKRKFKDKHLYHSYGCALTARSYYFGNYKNFYGIILPLKQ